MGFNKTLMVAMLLVVLSFVALSALLFEVVGNYNIPVEQNYEDIFNEYDAIQQEYAQQQSTIENGTINPEGQADAVFTDAIAAGKQAQSSGQLFFRFAAKSPMVFRVSIFIISVFVTIVLFLSMMGFIRLVMKEDP